MEKYWIWLHELTNITPTLKHRLLETFDTPEAIFNAKWQDLPEGLMSREYFDQFRESKDLTTVDRIMEDHEKLGIRALTLGQAEYPARIKDQRKPPLVIYYRGLLPRPGGVAVLGSREPTTHGYHYTHALLDRMVRADKVTNSTMETGIETLSLETALEKQGGVQAFVSHGLDGARPKTRQRLFDRIQHGGSLLSLHAAGAKQQKHYFFKKLDLIARWSDMVLVVEAIKNGPTMITIDYAKRHNTAVWTLRGQPDAPTPTSNRKLIAGGAKVIRDLELPDGLQDLDQDLLIKTLRQAPHSLSQLAEKHAMTTAETEERLLELEINRCVGFHPDGRWHYLGW